MLRSSETVVATRIDHWLGDEELEMESAAQCLEDPVLPRCRVTSERPTISAPASQGGAARVLVQGGSRGRHVAIRIDEGRGWHRVIHVTSR